VKDWKSGDPSWKGGKGKGIIGALNYLAAKGVNSVYFLTYNIDGGDGRDTWMWTDVDTRDRYDWIAKVSCSTSSRRRPRTIGGSGAAQD
jgi:hypothetical protein